MMRIPSFTLIELVVVTLVILIVTALVLPAITTMWNRAHVQNAHQKISNLLRTARKRSTTVHHSMYGLFFFIDPVDNHETAVFIDGLMYPIAPDEKYPDVCARFIVDTKNKHLFPLEDFVRISPFETLEWEDVDLLNKDYRAGKQRNFFAIIFQRGYRAYPHQFILYDEDKDDDGLGDTLGLPVGDTVGPNGGPLRDILIDANDERIIIPTDWGFLIYDEDLFKELSPNNLESVPHVPYYLTRFGETVELESVKISS